MKIIFFGTSNVALPVLEALHQHHDVVAVITMPDSEVGRKKELSESPVAVLAKEMEIPIFKPENLTSDVQTSSALTKLESDIAIVVSYGKLIPNEILNIPKFKTLNIHFSLLPKYRGAAPLQYALLNGETETGVTVFQLDEKLDHGPIVAQEKYLIEPDDNFITLSQRLAFESGKLILKVIPDYVSGLLTLLPQDETQVTLSSAISKQDGKINWSKTAQEIYNQFRAFYPWPGIWTIWNGIWLKVIDCTATELQNWNTTDNYRCGQILESGVVVCGSNTFLQIKSLQLAGKKETDIKSFLNGYKNFVGSVLG